MAAEALEKKPAKVIPICMVDKNPLGSDSNFFKRIAEENEKLQKYGAEPVKPIDRIKQSYEKAMEDTDNRLLTQSNAKTSTRSKKAMTPEEARKVLEAEAAKETKETK